MPINRRDFLYASGACAGLAVAPGIGSAATVSTSTNVSSLYRSPNEQLGIGYIGTGIRFHTSLGNAGTNYGPGIAVADVDFLQAGKAVQRLTERHREKKYPIAIQAHEDYRKVLDNKEIDVVFIASPDHWHTKHVIEAMRAEKDVYCEKPLTLTIAEGQLIEKVQAETKRIVQVGTQQRTEFGQRFSKAAAIVRDGRVGKVKLVTICVGGSRTCKPLPIVEPPKSLNWDMWLGQAPMTDYRCEPNVTDIEGWGAGHPFGRTHRYYRWFYEYSGGKLTDWGAHHVDIAMIAVNKMGDDIGNIEINPLEVSHPVNFEKGMPTKDDQFNCATAFKVELKFDDGLVMHIRHEAQADKGFQNGIMFEGDKGKMLVNRGKLVGRPVEDLKSNPLPSDAIEKLYGQPMPKSHADNFIECVKSRKTPISDLKTHNRMLDICHAVNISMRLNRKLTYDPKNRKFIGDEIANSFVSREQRKGFELS